MSFGRWIELYKMVRKIGPWTGVRYLRNQGVAFDQAHEIVLGYPPRLV